MKKNKILFLTIVALAGISNAGSLSEDDATEITLGLSTMSPFIATSAPTGTIGGVAMNNDIVMVNTDAVVALETGFISDNLASVIEKMKNSDASIANASDDQLIQLIIGLNQSAK